MFLLLLAATQSVTEKKTSVVSLFLRLLPCTFSFVIFHKQHYQSKMINIRKEWHSAWKKSAVVWFLTVLYHVVCRFVSNGNAHQNRCCRKNNRNKLDSSEWKRELWRKMNVLLLLHASTNCLSVEKYRRFLQKIQYQQFKVFVLTPSHFFVQCLLSRFVQNLLLEFTKKTDCHRVAYRKMRWNLASFGYLSRCFKTTETPESEKKIVAFSTCWFMVETHPIIWICIRVHWTLSATSDRINAKMLLLVFLLFNVSLSPMPIFIFTFVGLFRFIFIIVCIISWFWV